MWANKGRLPIVLEPERYVARDHHDREIEAIFLPGWHCVGALDDMPNESDFFTTELLGRPLLLRNVGGRPRALLNVCAHRHAVLTSARRGHCDRTRCQVHGWEYDDEGVVCKVPDARSFTPIGRGAERERLRRFRAEVRERLIFVSLADQGPGLDEALGPVTRALIDEGFGPRFREVARWEIDHPANWKVPVENAIESYHVPVVHPSTFQVMPPEEDEEHELGDGYSEHRDSDNAKSVFYRAAMRALRRAPHYSYRHHHRFPSLMIAATDAMSLLQVILPTSPTTSRSMIRAYAYGGEPGWISGRILSRALGLPIRRFVGQVLAEDGAILGAVQRGLTSPEKSGPGALGAREERVHLFQQWVANRVG
jgi:choline monooxygenase